MPPPVPEASLHKFPKGLERARILGPMSSGVAVPACRCDVRACMSAAIAAGVLVLSGSLQQASAPGADAFEFRGAAQPHGRIAVDAAAMLTVECARSLDDEVCHVVTNRVRVDPVRPIRAANRVPDAYRDKAKRWRFRHHPLQQHGRRSGAYIPYARTGPQLAGCRRQCGIRVLLLCRSTCSQDLRAL